MSLNFDNISFSYGPVEVLNDINLTARSGDITCLLGASGSGKSTLLRLAAGMEPVQQGRIALDDNTLASASLHPPPEQRPVGMMFQESALFPHMNIADNIAFGLAHLPRAQQQERVASMLQLVEMTGYDKRYPHSLSGGQQQRVALARSLAPYPKVLLMDEPYANIDITLRRALREAARLILKQNDTATILVTHDPLEASEMADSIALLHDGRVVQCGSPRELYTSPSCTAVASLYGDAQIITGQADGNGYVTSWGVINADPQLSAGAVCQLAFRPAGIVPEYCEEGECEVVDERFVAGGIQLSLQAQGETQVLRVMAPEQPLQRGDRVSLRAAQSDFFVFGE